MADEIQPGNQLEDWYARHIVAMVFQVLSMLGSLVVIASFFMLKERRRNPFHYEVLFLNIADFVWVLSHFTNHAEALAHNHVTTNHTACSTMGMFTHMGIGWELCWLIVIAVHSITMVSQGMKGVIWSPSRRLMIIVTVIAWGFPVLWWAIIGLSLDAYGSTGYFCWVKFDPAYISILFGDLPLLICCFVVTSCYTYLVYLLMVHSGSTSSIGGSKFKREIRRSLSYVLVYVLWVHPYLTLTLLAMTGANIPRGFWLYFLAMVNSMGTFNFFAYGFSEKWFRELQSYFGCTLGASSESNRSSRSSKGASMAEDSNTIEKSRDAELSV